MLNSLQLNLKWIWVYSISFIVIVNWFFKVLFAFSPEVSKTFMLQSVKFQLPLILVFSFLIIFFSSFRLKPGVFAKGALLLLSSEICFFFFYDQVSLFGLFENGTGSLAEIHRLRNISFSLSVLLSAGFFMLVCYFIEKPAERGA